MDRRLFFYYITVITVPFFSVSPWQKIANIPVGIIYGILVAINVALFRKEIFSSFVRSGKMGIYPATVILFIGVALVSFSVLVASGAVRRENFIRIAYLLFSGVVLWLNMVVPAQKEVLLRTVQVYIASAMVAAVYGIFVVIGYMVGLPTGLEVLWTVPRLLGTATEPQVFGNFMLTALPLSAAVYLFKPDRHNGKFLLWAFGIFMLALIMTFSAGAWAGAAVGCFMLVFFIRRFQVRRVLFLALACLLVVTSVLAIDRWIYPNYVAGFKSIMVKFTQKPPGQDLPQHTYEINMISVNDRKWLRAAAWNMFREKPLFGVGFGNFGYLYNNYRPADTPKFDFYARAHNQYLEILAEMGLLGFGALLAVLVQLVITVWKSLKYGPAQEIKGVILGLFASLAAIGVHGYSFGIMFHNYVWVIMGLTYAACRLAVGRKGENCHENRY
ncbi:O-antigen ligase family protein [Thermincola ferriacetica]